MIRSPDQLKSVASYLDNSVFYPFLKLVPKKYCPTIFI